MTPKSARFWFLRAAKIGLENKLENLTLMFTLFSRLKVIEWKKMVEKHCCVQGCSEVFDARGTQTHCEKHIKREHKTDKHLTCLWCEKRIFNKSKFCNNDCLIRYRITGKTKAQVEKAETESRVWTH